MKKLLTIILSVLLLLLTSCGGEEKETAVKEYAEGYETARRNNSWSNLNLNGMFYFVDRADFMSPQLWFFDFDSMKSAILCARPNCPHDDPDVCTAFEVLGWICHPTIVENNLYFFRYRSEWDKDEKLHNYQDIYKAELDGSSRVKIDTLEDVDYIQDLVMKGSVAYFTTIEEEEEPHTGVATGNGETYICSYDFINKEYNKWKLTDYPALPSILGEYNGGLYIRDYNSIFLRFDLETGEITDWDMPLSSINEYDAYKPMFASGGYYGYMDGDNAVIIDSEGNEMVFENYDLQDNINAIPVNGYYFNSDGTAIDLSTGEILELNKGVIPKYSFVLCYHDGSYIIHGLGSNFKKVPEDEMFKRSEP